MSKIPPVTHDCICLVVTIPLQIRQIIALKLFLFLIHFTNHTLKAENISYVYMKCVYVCFYFYVSLLRLNIKLTSVGHGGFLIPLLIFFSFLYFINEEMTRYVLG
jgi:hypothetical protein